MDDVDFAAENPIDIWEYIDCDISLYLFYNSLVLKQQTEQKYILTQEEREMPYEEKLSIHLILISNLEISDLSTTLRNSFVRFLQ